MMRALNSPCLALFAGLAFTALAAYSQGIRIVHLDRFDVLTQIDISGEAGKW